MNQLDVQSDRVVQIDNGRIGGLIRGPPRAAMAKFLFTLAQGSAVWSQPAGGHASCWLC